MQKGIDLVISELEEKLITTINSSGLPPTVVKLILSGLLRQVDMQSQIAIKQQEKEYEKGEDDGEEVCKD